MTYFGPHERTVVQGGDACQCGSEWPCEKSAEGRWAVLRATVASTLADFEGLPPADNQATDIARASMISAYKSVLSAMDELED